MLRTSIQNEERDLWMASLAQGQFVVDSLQALLHERQQNQEVVRLWLLPHFPCGGCCVWHEKRRLMPGKMSFVVRIRGAQTFCFSAILHVVLPNCCQLPQAAVGQQPIAVGVPPPSITLPFLE